MKEEKSLRIYRGLIGSEEYSIELMREALANQEIIRMATEEINKLQTRIDSITEELLANDIHEAGNYCLIEKTRTSRKVNIERFKAKFPEAFQNIIEVQIERARREAGKHIDVKDAEYVVGKEALDPLCDQITTVKFVYGHKEIE